MACSTCSLFGVVDDIVVKVGLSEVVRLVQFSWCLRCACGSSRADEPARFSVF